MRPSIPGYCAVDTPLLIARFLPLCDTLVRNSNRLCGKKTYSHFRACFRLFIAIERFAMVSHSVHVRFTLALFVLSPDACHCIGRRAAFSRPTRDVVSGDASCCVARYEAMSWSDARPPWPFRSTDPVTSVYRLGPTRSTDSATSVDRFCYLGGPIAALRRTDFVDSVYRVCRPSGEPPFDWMQIKWCIEGCVMWRDGDWSGI